MSGQIGNAKKRCQAMIDAGVEEPESRGGIEFCTGKCPYPYCVVFEKPARGSKEKVALAKKLRKHGISTKDIALILGRSTLTVRGYLRRK